MRWFCLECWCVGACLLLGFAEVAAEQPSSEKDLRAHLPTPKEQNQAEALKLYSRALLKKADHRYVNAIRTLEEAARLDPESAAIQRALAEVQLLLDQTTEALASYRKALELEPGDGEAWLVFGRELRQQKQPREAATALANGVKCATLVDRPELRYTALLDLGDLYEELKEPAQAADTLQQALALLDKPDRLIDQGLMEADQVNARSAELLEHVGRAATKARQFDRAVAAFQKAQKIDSTRKALLNFNLSEVYLAQEDFKNALSCVDVYLKTLPAGLAAYERKILLMERLGKDRAREIVPALLKCVQADPDNLPLHLLYVQQLAKTGRNKEAEAAYIELAKLSPTPEVYRGLFALYAAQENGGDRILTEFNRQLAKAAAEDDQTAVRKLAAAQGRAMLAVLRSKPALVSLVLEAAGPKIGTHELAQQTRLFLAVLADHTKQLDQAERLYRSCLKDQGPNSRRDEQEVYSGLLRVLWRARKYQDTVDVCEDGLKNARFVNRVIFHADLARALGQLGKTEEALKQADQAVAAAGAQELLYARSIRVSIFSELGRYDDAVAECQAMLKEATKSEDIHEVRYALSSVYSLAKNTAKAEEELQILLESDPRDATANNDLGYLWAEQGKNLDEAEKLIRRALELDRKQHATGTEVQEDGEENAAYVDSLGWVLFRKGELKAAVAELEKAITLPTGTDDPTVWNHLGDVYYRLEQGTKARAAWQKAVELYDGGRRHKTDDHYKDLKQKLKLLEAPKK
jgi:tetratricopeptide (TPR) repeat protein